MHRPITVAAVGIILLLGLVTLVMSRQNPVYVRAADIPVVKSARDAVFFFGGDMMLDRTVRTALERSGEEALFSCLDEMFSQADFVVANLEGPITGNASRSIGSAIGSADNYVFTFPTSTAALLSRHNVSAVSLGNNHILNFGVDGLRTTLALLSESGIAPFGEPYGHSVAHLGADGTTFALIGYNEFDPVGWRMAASTTIEQISTEVSVGATPIVFAHWGEEYATSTERQKELAHEFVLAGARLIVGAHPHVVQESEHIGSVPVYYSLGNLVFDQYWNEQVRSGLVLKVVFSGNGALQVQEIPVRIGPGGRPCHVE